MDCFISYSSKDGRIAARLKQKLLQKGIRVFLAEDSIAIGGHWPSVIQFAARRSEVVLLLDSANSRTSPWVQQEAGMALASGSLLIPISLDGRPELLPGWLDGLQAATIDLTSSRDDMLQLVVDQVAARIGSSWSVLPDELRTPRTAGQCILRTVLLDQFSGPNERSGAWSRQHDRYLKIEYDSDIPSGASQGATLTFTGMVVERLSSLPQSLSSYAVNALGLAERFILSSQDSQEGGFGRLSSDVRVRGGRALTLDLRHTCWAIRALLSIDSIRLAPQIVLGLNWVVRRARGRMRSDRGCWTTAPLLALLLDPRLSHYSFWQKSSARLKASVESDLENSFDKAAASWAIDEARPNWLAVDNALYVLYCLKDCTNLSRRLQQQRIAAIERLVVKSWCSSDRGPSRGIPLFISGQPEVGPSAQLLEILRKRVGYRKVRAELANFVRTRVAEKETMQYTFSWHLCAALRESSLWKDYALNADRTTM